MQTRNRGLQILKNSTKSLIWLCTYKKRADRTCYLSTIRLSKNKYCRSTTSLGKCCVRPYGHLNHILHRGCGKMVMQPKKALLCISFQSFFVCVTPKGTMYRGKHPMLKAKFCILSRWCGAACIRNHPIIVIPWLHVTIVFQTHISSGIQAWVGFRQGGGFFHRGRQLWSTGRRFLKSILVKASEAQTEIQCSDPQISSPRITDDIDQRHWRKVMLHYPHTLGIAGGNSSVHAFH